MKTASGWVTCAKPSRRRTDPGEREKKEEETFVGYDSRQELNEI